VAKKKINKGLFKFHHALRVFIELYVYLLL